MGAVPNSGSSARTTQGPPAADPTETKPVPELATRTFVAALRFKITKDGAFDCEPIKGAVVSQTILLSKVGQEWMADITFVKAG